MLDSAPTRRRLRCAWAACATVAAVLASSAAPALAQPSPYPSRPITLIVPYSTGTTADTLARLLGAKLNERWNVPVFTVM